MRNSSLAKRGLSIFTTTAIALALPVTLALASGGGGGTVPQIAGTWNGITYFPQPVQTLQTIFILQEDAAGNLTGQVCFSSCFPGNGKITSSGGFEFRTEALDYKGLISGTINCAAGSIGTVINGSVSERGGTGSFSINSCQ